MRGRIGALTLVCVAVALAVPAAAAAAGSISGTVTDEAAGHAPIEKVRVCAFRQIPGEEEFEFETELGGNCELTNSAGGYAIGGLAAGKYAVEFWPGFEGLDYSYEYYENKPSPFKANLVQVTTTAKTGINAELAAGGAIHGKVVKQAGGAPIKEVLVCAEESESPEYIECAVTNTVGEYMIVGLPGGEYVVEFLPELGGLNYLRQVYNGKTFREEETLVPVTVGATTMNVNAALAEGGAITGTVTDALTHLGLTEVEVCALEAAKFEYVLCTETGLGGSYEIKGLPPGSYKVEFFPYSSLYPIQFWNDKPTYASANPIAVTAGVKLPGIDAALLKKATTPPATKSATTAMVPPPPAPIATPVLKCGKGKVKKLVKGKATCVKRHKKKHHRHAAKHRAAERSLRLAMRQR